jgi:hypothetical protein
MVWRIEGIGNTYRHAAAAAARRAGVSLGEWLDAAIRKHPDGPTRQDADAEIARALEALESRIDQSSQKLQDMIAPLRAEVDRLAAESHELRHGDQQNIARAEREVARQMDRLEKLARGEKAGTGSRSKAESPPDDKDVSRPYLDIDVPAASPGLDSPSPEPDPEADNHDPWTRHHPHGAPRVPNARGLQKRKLIRLAAGAGAVLLIVGSIGAGVWVIREHGRPVTPRASVPPGLTTPSPDQTPPPVIAEIVPDGRQAPGDAPRNTVLPGKGLPGATALPKRALPPEIPGNSASIAQLRARAEARDVDASYQLGLALMEGRGTPAAPKEGGEWISTAAVAGHPQAQLRLAHIYLNGPPTTGLARDPAQAFFWTQSAAEQGITEAEYELGMIYSQGNGVERSHALAARWFRKAGEKNHAPSLYQLGLIYELGLDYRANLARALEWYRKAAAAGSQAALDKLSKLSPTPGTAQQSPAPSPAKAQTAAPAPSPQPAQLTRADLAEIQRLLKSLDFDPGSADGRMGAKTADAIRQFQGIAGMPATGEPSADLLRQLREVTGFQR